MPKSVNKVILVGNVGKEPELKYSPSGTPIAKFSLATNERFKDRSGEWQDRVEWHTVVAWQRLAEILGEFVVTGLEGLHRGEAANLELGGPAKRPGTGRRS